MSIGILPQLTSTNPIPSSSSSGAGESYMRIHQSGGGIYFTVKETNKADYDVLLAKLKRTLNEMVRCGTTTVEIKTGTVFSTFIYFHVHPYFRSLSSTFSYNKNFVCIHLH